MMMEPDREQIKREIDALKSEREAIVPTSNSELDQIRCWYRRFLVTLRMVEVFTSRGQGVTFHGEVIGDWGDVYIPLMWRVRNILYWQLPLSEANELEELRDIAFRLFDWHADHHDWFLGLRGSPQHHDDRALIYAATREYGAAEQEITNHIELYPDDSEAYRFRANIFRERKDYHSALDDARLALRYADSESHKEAATSLLVAIYKDLGLSTEEADWHAAATLGEGEPQIGALQYDIVQHGRRIGSVEYGRCSHSPYKESELWFVVIRGRTSSEGHTFLVDGRYARPSTFQEWGLDVPRWRDVAHKVLIGPWCTRYQRLWGDLPVHEYTLADGTRVKYGYCRTQPKDPDRHLWFVAMKETGSCFIVDECFGTVESMNRMGRDRLKWWLVCWNDLDERDVQWDKLKTGTLDGGLVRNNSHFALDFMALPFSLEEAERRITVYEQTLPKVIKAYRMKPEEWERQPELRQREMIKLWAEMHGMSVFPY